MGSDCNQDLFVINKLNKLRNGTWVELGCSLPIKGSNTYVLEKEYDWSGISIDIDSAAINQWKGVRDTNTLILADARSLNYEELFIKYNLPESIDYLSIDLEPPPITFHVLQMLPFHKYKFKIITFEHDDYREQSKNLNIKLKSREFFKINGYVRIPENIVESYFNKLSLSEDWYIKND